VRPLTDWKHKNTKGAYYDTNIYRFKSNSSADTYLGAHSSFLLYLSGPDNASYQSTLRGNFHYRAHANKIMAGTVTHLRSLYEHTPTMQQRSTHAVEVVELCWHKREL
jgi:hypothetical protein